MPQESATFVALVQATAGAAGGVFATVVLMPLEVVKTRIQVRRTGDESTLSTGLEILRSEGLGALFRGVATKSSETGSKNFVYFYIYDALNQVAKRSAKVGWGMKLVLGYIAGVGTTTATMPLEVLSTQLQVAKAGESFLTALSRILGQEGIGGLFRGFWFNIALCVNPAIQNTCFDKLKEALLRYKAASDATKNVALSPLQAFVLGAVAKAIATVVTFPLVRLKTILQAEAALAEKPAPEEAPRPLRKENSASQALISMSLRADRKPSQQSLLERFAQLYRGLGPALSKSVLQAALLYMTKDQVESTVVMLFKQSSRMLRRRGGQVKLGAFSGRPLAS